MSNKLFERTISGLHDDLARSLPIISHCAPVLDIGCGTGAWLERLSSVGFSQLHGIDLDVKQFGTQKATYSQANIDCDDLGLGERKFALITSIEVIEHLENPGRLFYHVAKHLDENGYFLLTTPNIHSISCRLRFLMTGKLASFDEKGDKTHIYPVLLNCFQRILSRYSLEVIKQWGYPETGSCIYRNSLQRVSNILKFLSLNEVPGDSLCLLIQRKS